mmetsp:Transcript_2544/g.5571  ORF Transcript_2544/g.5571 Transcript_2544/m.5571 type:complete len:257 (-) Transcript_2544:303-1073(-)
MARGGKTSSRSTTRTKSGGASAFRRSRASRGSTPCEGRWRRPGRGPRPGGDSLGPLSWKGRGFRTASASLPSWPTRARWPPWSRPFTAGFLSGRRAAGPKWTASSTSRWTWRWPSSGSPSAGGSRSRKSRTPTKPSYTPSTPGGSSRWRKGPPPPPQQQQRTPPPWTRPGLLKVAATPGPWLSRRPLRLVQGNPRTMRSKKKTPRTRGSSRSRRPGSRTRSRAPINKASDLKAPRQPAPLMPGPGPSPSPSLGTAR